jgi:hypothetical protein
MPRPIHRSLTLWLGCFGVVFILWAWADSRKTDTLLIFPGGPPYRYLTSGEACLGSVFISGASIDHWEIYRMQGRSYPAFPRPRFHEKRSDEWRPTYETFIPYWLILAVYLPCWFLLLWLRARRHRAAAKNALLGQ